MTEPNDSHASTRPISVAELLAKNGAIGAPPVGGRRRRRRGNADAVTVAELTGEMPIISVDNTSVDAADTVEAAPEPEAEADPDEPAAEEAAEAEAETETPDAEPEPVEDEQDSPVGAVDVEADFAAYLQQREVDPEPLAFAPRPRRAHGAARRPAGPPAGGAEEMSPDPVLDEDTPDAGTVEESRDTEAAALPSYLRSSTDTLFGGDSVADDLARRPRSPGPEDIDLDGPADTAPAIGERQDASGSPLVRGGWIVAQCVLAVAFGAGLFVAFDQLWKWNNIVALVLSVLVILGLVVGVRVVRKTEDIASTLIAVAVGAMVTLGPLALLQST